MKNKIIILQLLILSLFNYSHAFAKDESFSSRKDSLKSPSINLPGMPQSSIVQSLVFAGQPGFIATAAIVTIGNDEPRLIIAHNKHSQKKQKIDIDNRYLALNIGGMAGTESSLGLSENGLLMITNQNDAVGRDRWKKTITIKFHQGEYVVSQIQSTSYDTLQADSSMACEYNLLTGTGVVEKKSIKEAQQHIALKNLKESQQFTLCGQW